MPHLADENLPLTELGTVDLVRARALRETVESLEKEALRVRKELKALVRTAVLSELQRRKAASSHPEVRALPPPRRLVAPVTGWDCPTSPSGVCAYDGSDDPCHDFCLFCGHPEERK